MAWENYGSCAAALVEILAGGGVLCTQTFPISFLSPKGVLQGPLGIRGTQFGNHCLKCFKKKTYVKHFYE